MPCLHEIRYLPFIRDTYNQSLLKFLWGLQMSHWWLTTTIDIGYGLVIIIPADSFRLFYHDKKLRVVLDFKTEEILINSLRYTWQALLGRFLVYRVVHLAVTICLQRENLPSGYHVKYFLISGLSSVIFDNKPAFCHIYDYILISAKIHV